jgi:hypothetical protein
VLAGNPLGDLEQVPGWITVSDAPGLGVALAS